MESCFQKHIYLGGAALGSNFGKEKELCAAISIRSFEKPKLCGLALERNFGVSFRSNFAEQLWEAALENNFGNLLGKMGLNHRNFGATALRPCFGNNFGK